MTRLLLAGLALLALAAPGRAAEPDKFPLPKVAVLGAADPVPLGELVALSLSPPEDAPPTLAATSVQWKVFDYDPKGGVVEKRVRTDADGWVLFGAGVKDKKMLVVASVTHLYLVKDGDRVLEAATRTQLLVAQLTIGVPPPVPPGPTPPGPEPGPTPPPGPVSSFRAVLVFESGQTVTAAQTSVLYGKAVEEFLEARTTKDGARPGWLRLDKDQGPPADAGPTMAALWAAVKPKVTATPCLAVAVNDRVVIEPLPATPADAVALLKRHLGEK